MSIWSEGLVTEVSIIYQYLDDAFPQPSLSFQSVSAVIGRVNHQSFSTKKQNRNSDNLIQCSAVQWVSSHRAWSPKASLRSPHRAPKVSPASLPKDSKEIFYKVNRCFARYSPRAMTTNQQGTKWAGKANMCPGKHILGQKWLFLGQTSWLLCEGAKVLVPIYQKTT